MTLKRFAAPAFWPIEKKTKKYTLDPKPGPHSKEKCIPLGIVLRDILGYAMTSKEADHILGNNSVKVDGKVRKSKNFGVGLMDIVTVGDLSYRVLPGKKGLGLVKIEGKDASLKFLKITNITHMKKGAVQISFHDGSNMLADKNLYHTNDIAVFDINSRKIKEIIKLDKGCKALVVGGKNMGSIVTVIEIVTMKSSMPNQIVVDMEGKVFTLPNDYVFAIGKDTPVIKIGEKK